MADVPVTRPRRHYNTELGQMVWVPRRLYGWLRTLAAAEHRTISRQLELIVKEWLWWGAEREEAGMTEGERTERLREAEKEWMGQ